LDIVSQAYVPSYLGGRGLKDHGSRPAQAKFKRPISTNNCSGMLLFLAIWESTNRNITAQASSDKKQDPNPKTTHAKRTGAQLK
jgi:hypothetical protein